MLVFIISSSCCHSNSREAGKKWFQGTADAVRQFHWLFEDPRSKDIEDVLILSGDHLYQMDYVDFVQSNMRILVTGGARFIGSHLVDRLMENEKMRMPWSLEIDCLLCFSLKSEKNLLAMRGRVLVRDLRLMTRDIRMRCAFLLFLLF
ncbi:inactive glucose-1-phosphate adenylyltransferase small subunit 2, chloroplastic-like [Arachis duranensis]|uniref:glucose-1-phosphate adenylyltransferase n=1 Tax=Arachis duranensis TaxID=130453 RepID=A0A9C6TMQ5_ARADU|nr:inactive glucose-1-phosphate adenylyltransferase small subunit 2, chloroplastic-like [Arachis duranensis]